MAPVEHYAGVIGQPVAHSLSPRLHGAAAEFLKLKVEYAAYNIAFHELKNFVFRLRKKEHWRGLSVTMPHKQAMADFIDDASEDVAQLSLLNTVVIRDGHWTGHNTDISGIVAALKRAVPQQGNSVAHVAGAADGANGCGGSPPRQWLILGAGATACSALKAAQLLEVENIVLAVRDLNRASHALECAYSMRLNVQVKKLDAIATCEIPEFGTIISTLPPLAADGFAATLEKADIDLRGTTVLDVAYDPWPSRIARSTHASGAAVIDGKYMLLFQALEQVRLFFPEETRFYGQDMKRTIDFEKHVGHAIGVILR